jgi:hypothetical protein
MDVDIPFLASPPPPCSLSSQRRSRQRKSSTGMFINSDFMESTIPIQISSDRPLSPNVEVFPLNKMKNSPVQYDRTNYVPKFNSTLIEVHNRINIKSKINKNGLNYNKSISKEKQEQLAEIIEQRLLKARW